MFSSSIRVSVKRFCTLVSVSQYCTYINYCCCYSYFQEMDRILAGDYTPNEQDVLRSRVRTTGVVETAFKVGRLIYR